MKSFGKFLFIMAFIMSSICYLGSCTNEEETPVVTPTTITITPNANGKITYESINPLFIATCGGSTCHTSREKPLLISNYAVAKASGSSIVSEVVNKTMPENTILTAAQIAAVKQWQTDGFLEK